MFALITRGKDNARGNGSSGFSQADHSDNSARAALRAHTPADTKKTREALVPSQPRVRARKGNTHHRHTKAGKSVTIHK